MWKIYCGRLSCEPPVAGCHRCHPATRSEWSIDLLFLSCQKIIVPVVTSGAFCTEVVDFYALTFLLILALFVCSQLLVLADIPTDTWVLFLTSPRLHRDRWGECAEYSPCSESSPPPAHRSSACRINHARPWNLVLGKAVCVQQGWHRGVMCKGSRVSTAGRSLPPLNSTRLSAFSQSLPVSQWMTKIHFGFLHVGIRFFL